MRTSELKTLIFNVYPKKLKRPIQNFVLIGFLWALAFSQAEAMPHSYPSKDTQRCLKLLEKAENLYGIPPQLLKAIALTESGRMQGDRFVPWPWTINVNGKGFFYATKTEAIQAVRNFQKKGIKSIDVGCMQINLMHHPDAFDSLEEAFDPASNIRYGAEFLVRLRDNNKGVWKQAVGLYHSGRPDLYEPYRQKVIKIWYENRKQKHRLNPYRRQSPPPWQSSYRRYMQHDENEPVTLAREARLVLTKASLPSQTLTSSETKRVPSLKALRGTAIKMLYATDTQASTTRLRQVKSRLRPQSRFVSAKKFDPPVKKILPLRASYQTINPNLKPGPLIMAYNLKNIS